MYKVVFSFQPKLYLSNYRQRFLQYFLATFTDTGIWSEDEIILQYTLKADERHNHIIDIITERLSEEILTGRTPNNTVTLQWSGKNILVTFDEAVGLRTVTSIIFK